MLASSFLKMTFSSFFLFTSLTSAFTLHSSKIFNPSAYTRKYSLSMSTWGVQKLGQSVIGTGTISTPTEEQESTTSIFKRIPVGSGNDYRESNGKKEEALKWETLSTIDKSFQQKTLLMGLESVSMGSTEKIERIRLASTVESLLPSSFATETLKTSNIRAGGLMKDWDF